MRLITIIHPSHQTNILAAISLGYIVKSSAGINWVYQRNVLFLEDFLRAETLEIGPEMIDYLRSRVAAIPGMPLADLLAETTYHGITSDCIYIAIVTDQIYVDLKAAPLAGANRRYAILSAYRASGWTQELGVTVRTLQRWEASVRQAEVVYQCGYAGLLRQIKLSGNRTHRLPEETRKLMEEHVAKECFYVNRSRERRLQEKRDWRRSQAR